MKEGVHDALEKLHGAALLDSSYNKEDFKVKWVDRYCVARLFREILIFQYSSGYSAIAFLVDIYALSCMPMITPTPTPTRGSSFSYEK